MFAHTDKQEPTGQSIPQAVMCGEPTSIFAALFDGLTRQEHYTVEMRDGELHIEPNPRHPGVLVRARAA